MTTSRPTIVALADDFSGAAEIAGVAHRHGLDVHLTNTLPESIPTEGTALVIDTDTRRHSEEKAISIHQQLAEFLQRHFFYVYKKTDSVLRGHITAELRTILTLLPKSNVLFIPANPARKRTIIKGRYAIDGTPLHHTEFANDPKAPITTDSVTEILPDFQHLPLEKPSLLTKTNGQLFIADTSTETHLHYWAKHTAESILPAGASPFFAAYLQHLGHQSKPRSKLNNQQSSPDNPTLLLCGSFSNNSRRAAELFRHNHWPILELTGTNQPQFPADSPIALIKLPAKIQPNPDELPQRLANWLQQYLETCSVPAGNILIEGGDTAAAILQTFGWNTFQVLDEWEPGVVTLRPQVPGAPKVTIKPGSYAWPEDIFPAR